MTGTEDAADHLLAIDASSWPGVASVPAIAGGALRSRRAEAAFARACAKGGLALDGAAPDLEVLYSDVFTRLAASGWIGLAEGYLAGEWRVESSAALVRVLEALLRAGFNPKTPRIAPERQGAGGETPAALVAHFSGDGVSPFQGHFSTGVPTTQRSLVKSHAPGAGRGHQPAKHYVDITEYAAPLDAHREDLADAQARSVRMLLDAVRIRPGKHLLVLPACGSALPAAAAAEGATVDCLAATDEAAETLREQLVFAGVSDIHVASPGESRYQGTYDAVVSVEHLETLAHKDKVAHLQLIDASLTPHTRATLQMVARADRMPAAAVAALQSLRAYVWPGLSLSTPAEVGKLVDQHTGMRVVAHTRAPEHLAASLRLQRATFDTHLRDAAADGFDVVYRRLWTWQLALREALARIGALDLTQITMVAR